VYVVPDVLEKVPGDPSELSMSIADDPTFTGLSMEWTGVLDRLLKNMFVLPWR